MGYGHGGQGGLVQTEDLDSSNVPEAQADTNGFDSRGVSTGAVIAAVSLAAACGGGGGNGGTPPAPSPPPGPPPAKASTDAEAVRFALQAQFSVSTADITTLRNDGYLAWLNANFTAPLGQTGVAWLNAQGHNSITAEQRYFWPQFGDFMIWNQLLAGPDQMRKRMALALSEFFVVSLSPIDGFYPPYVIAAYWDELCANAFGNFRTLLERMTLNAAMGFFLNTRGNLKEDATTGRQPDENYAREVMQLFTIGLYELNPDGTNRLDTNGNPIETYGQSDITNLARVFTGYDWDFRRCTFHDVAWADYNIPTPEFAIDPMRFIANNHSTLDVSFLETNIPGSTSGPEKLRIALDRLFNHPNTGPFFARQMIQRLVTSNPSPAYVGRVAAAFANNGSGTRGDLRAVWTAILMDEEARASPSAANTLGGKLREPVMRWVQMLRTVGVSSNNGRYEIYDTSAAHEALGQSPLRSPSVFNFFRPGYVPPNTAIAAAGKQAPEFQLLNETTTAGYINFLQWTTRWPYGDVGPAYTQLLPIAHDVPQVLAWLNLRLSANQLSTQTLATIQAVMTAFNITAASSNDAKLDMLATACFLVLICPEYLVQK
jgi:uncharacterized protein (DUF1800 family)